MNIQEILTQAQQSCDAVEDLLIELDQQNKGVTAAARKACDLYFEDVRFREKGVQDKIAALEKQKAELDAQIRGMQATVVDAAGTGNADTFSQAQDKLAAIEARKSAIATQISMLQAAHVRGSEEIYQAACDAYSALQEANSTYAKALGEIHPVVEEMIKRYGELEGNSKYTTYYFNTGHVSVKGGTVLAFEKMREHYNKQPEAPKKLVAEESVRNLETGRVTFGDSANIDKGPRFESPVRGQNGPR